ncbi:uncharacterized protein LOC116437266 [Corvus moneduloides]|uniref:Uncharacterized protein n=1 Tax=Corvus moneduloides TaxID=1196302 RepID=A0A8U7NG24_CORMO|nr:uncharacterized protein LOC116437266 [Corvus moneduloides]XP_031950804.1 uncharacterized protein LOC116437266 [Corvus moneduloides]XP_031950805.1 uncharacterized protein LOC116437266 [Corvus moneduloides]
MLRQTVVCLGCEVSAGQRTLGQDQKEATCRTPKPQTVKELRTFLGMTGWCRLWIYNYGLLVKPFCALVAEGNRDLQWTKEATQAFNQLKKTLMSAPALGLPAVSKPFLLFSHKKQGLLWEYWHKTWARIAGQSPSSLDAAAQAWPGCLRAVTAGALNIQDAAKGWPGCLRAVTAVALNIQDAAKGWPGCLRAVTAVALNIQDAAKGWPGCLRAVTAVALNIQDAHKFTLGLKMTVLVSHTVSAVLGAKGGPWLSPRRFLKYQTVMVERDDAEMVVTNIVNPASFLSGNLGEPVIHDCLETIKATYSSRLDLKATPLEDTETWFTDGSSGKRHAGYAGTTNREVTESGSSPTNTSAQKAAIIALTRALELAKGKKISIYTDSRYAFGVVHAHGTIWKERGLLNSQGKNIKHAQEIINC